ncbi:hypothetical protein [Dongia sp.]|uniref:hypothetical protein n=1 Tax=Dongia sp. TaxID=1977262 RepID=UPI0035B22EE0
MEWIDCTTFVGVRRDERRHYLRVRSDVICFELDHNKCLPESSGDHDSRQFVVLPRFIPMLTPAGHAQ